MGFTDSELYKGIKKLLRISLYILMFYVFIFSPIWVLLLSHFQSEALVGLGEIHNAESICYQNNSEFCELYSDLTLGFYEDGKYVFFLSPTEFQGKSIEKLGLNLPINFQELGTPVPGLTEDGYVAVAIGNIDLDEKLDIWCINQDGKVINPKSDVFNIWVVLTVFYNSYWNNIEIKNKFI